jgi:hypothetical protein
MAKALIAQLVEHVLGKNGVMGSNPIEGSERQGLMMFLEGEQIVWESKNLSAISRT